MKSKKKLRNTVANQQLMDAICGLMMKPRYPTLITKELITVSPLYCLVVYEEVKIGEL